MVWTRLDDGFWCNPKIAGLSDRAFRLHINALNWSTGSLTDGLIPDHMLAYFIRTGEQAARSAAQELQRARLWHQVPLGFQINDFLEFQPSKADVRAKRKSHAERGSKGNHVRWHTERVDDCEWCDAIAIPTAIATATEVGKGQRPDRDRITESTRPDPSHKQQLADSDFAEFNRARARRVAKDRSVDKPEGYAWKLERAEDFVEESVRLWLLREEHRDCEKCGGSGEVEAYAPGSGMRRMECAG